MAVKTKPLLVISFLSQIPRSAPNRRDGFSLKKLTRTHRHGRWKRVKKTVFGWRMMKKKLERRRSPGPHPTTSWTEGAQEPAAYTQCMHAEVARVIWLLLLHEGFFYCGDKQLRCYRSLRQNWSGRSDYDTFPSSLQRFKKSSAKSWLILNEHLTEHITISTYFNSSWLGLLFAIRVFVN